MDQHEPVGGDGFALALQVEGLERLDLHRVADQAVCGVAEDDLAGCGGLFEPGGHVHGVATDESLRAGGSLLPRHDLAGVHPDPDLERDAVVAFELLVEPPHRGAHVLGGAHGTHRVVLVQRRDAEHRHHRVPDELLHRSTVALDRGGHLLEVPAHDAAEGLRVEPLAQRGRARDVAEYDRDGLANLGGPGGRRPERRAAERAERELLRGLAAAGRAGEHGASVGVAGAGEKRSTAGHPWRPLVRTSKREKEA